MATTRQQRTADPSYDVFHGTPQPLDFIFKPNHVAVIGATDRKGSVGRTLMRNLLATPFGGTVYPVNPKRSSVLGVRAYPSIAGVPDTVDLAIIVTPAPTVPSLIQECGEAGVRGVIIISAGFKEIGEEGRALEREIEEALDTYDMRVIGPNCLGIMRPGAGLNATFAGSMAQPGSVALLSQSGAMLTSILDWSREENVGFSTFASVGSMLDVDWGDLIGYLGDDPRTKSILVYMESIGDARSFISAAREVALQKPIIVIKAGRTAEAAQAATSHTGALAGSDEVLSAAFRRTGVLRVDTIADLFHVAEVLAKQPRPSGPNLTILTNAGGPGVLATDALIQGGGKLTALSAETLRAFDEVLPPTWSKANPVDLIGDATAQRYADALRVAGDDEESDGMLVVLSPQDMTDATRTAEELRPYAEQHDKPVLASWMGGAEVAAGTRILNDAGIPTFEYPDKAAKIFNYMWRYNYNLQALYETPRDAGNGQQRRDDVNALLTKARSESRTLLTEAESKEVLALHGIPTVTTTVATTPEAAVEAAHDIGYPVVVKLHSRTVTHKTDVGGVKLNLPSAEAVRAAFEDIATRMEEAGKRDGFDGVTVQPMISVDGYELIVGSSLDEQFGPVLLFGSGGSLVEVYRDRALGLPPLNTTLARRMIEQTRIHEALKGVRGRAPVDMDALTQVMVRFSQLVVAHPMIKEMDINPLVASGDEIIALDARVVLHAPDVDRFPRPAIRPYPQQYVDTWQLADGRLVRIRPIRPEDEPKLVEFHEHLSERSVYLRYASLMKYSQRVAHERLSRLCFIDYDREMALVAVALDPETDEEGPLLGAGRITKLRGTDDGEFAMLIRDDHQGQGLGTELLRRFIHIGREEGLERIVADILKENRPMQGVCTSLGFEIVYSDDLADQMVKAVKQL